MLQLLRSSAAGPVEEAEYIDLSRKDISESTIIMLIGGWALVKFLCLLLHNKGNVSWGFFNISLKLGGKPGAEH